ncbi:MAG TPA: PIG-L family deacetylase [Spirochaetia bacterium]|nr:PIG-L family deacetylase [Spirochaetia bacterium]
MSCRTRLLRLVKASAPSVLAAALLLLAPVWRVPAQVRPVYSQGAAGILQQIQKLRTTASVMVVGAHPDDEDSAFMARAARGDHARVVYLSLNRGEGGQNAVGPELFDALGVIRTEELLQARALDGGEQLFTRAFDFGFSKTLAEASRMWGEREVLKDVVRAIRSWRPLVVYSVFSGTPADGHGHHQFSGRITPEAFHAAADPAQFPDQIAGGLRPWQALKLYRAVAFGMFGPVAGPDATARVEVGQLDPVLGRSYAEIAAEGRDQHRSQKMGVPELLGQRQAGLVLLESRVGTASAETSPFDGIDTSTPALADLAGLPSGSLRNELAAIDDAVERSISGFSALKPQDSVAPLAAALRAIRSARTALQRIQGAAPDSRADADFLLSRKEQDAVTALQLASGTIVDAISDRETVNDGQSFRAAVRVFLSHPELVTVGDSSLTVPTGWRAAPSALPVTGAGAVGAADPLAASLMLESADHTDVFTILVPDDAPATQPYWLVTPRSGWLYTWPVGRPQGEPFDPPLVTAAVHAEIGGVPVTLQKALQYRTIDPVRGELHRNLDVVPAVTASVDPQLLVVPLARLGQAVPVTIRLQNNSPSGVSGSARLEIPTGWKSLPAEIPFTLRAEGEAAALTFQVTPGKGTGEGGYTIRAVAAVPGRTFDTSMRVISYPHIQTHRIFSPAEALVRVLDLKVRPGRIGYIMGSGDLVPDALRRMGCDVTLLSDDDLAAGDLSRFATIVVGIRASEARPGFAAASARLLDYVRAGGTLVVQYQQPGYERLAPLPGRIGSRVTDETAPVSILSPGNPVFTTPNMIGPRDFDGWVQERSLYAFTSFDPAYSALLESHDPGEPAQNGGELYLRLGRGTFVYTAYAWFRQLPAGVPGAYRMFANLVSLGAPR